jgi:hypothetical protein
MIELYQSPVVFDEVAHQYWLNGKELKGVTGTLIKRAFPDTYKDVPPDTLMKAAEHGHAIHKCIEEYEKEFKFDDIPELSSYVKIKEEQQLRHIAAEYLVSDEERYASQIDHVFMDANDEIVIADIKTTYKPLYDHVALQLSIYKRMFEWQNKKLKVSKCALIWLRGDKYEYKELTPWGDEFLDDLFSADINDDVFDITKTYGTLPIKVAEIENYLVELDKEVKRKTDELKAIKDGLCQLMLEKGIKKYSTSRLQMTTVTPKPKQTFDTKRFQQEHKDLYNEYLSVSEIKPSIRLTIK